LIRLLVGLTGGIASGKSRVGDLFAARGVPLLDADQVAREVVEPGSAGLAAIIRDFGVRFVDAGGRLDRAALRRHVFAAPAARRHLEALLHPLIRDRLHDWRERTQAPWALYSAAILIESGMHRDVERVLVVDAPEAVQFERLCRRDGITGELAREMLAAQTSRAQRLDRADDVIRNDGPIDRLVCTVAQLAAAYARQAGA
jgi:dephospho-CoA kinase (EC 2.7.1.24)